MASDVTRPLVVGNWKMNVADGGSGAFARQVAKLGPYRCRVAICVPHPFLSEVDRALRGTEIAIGAQDCSDQHAGAFTGEVSARMLATFSCAYVIVGHSERRARHLENDLAVATKAKMALDCDITPIICVGETLAERNSGEALTVVSRQVSAVTRRLGLDVARCVFAYEPVWAIGSGRSASAEQAQAMHSFIRDQLAQQGSAAAAVSILYGGSVKPESTGKLLEQPDVDGVLVGGASLNLAHFSEICRVAGVSSGIGAAWPSDDAQSGASLSAEV